MKKSMREESLGTRLKGYEKEFESVIDPRDFIICRIDGHKFSKYTKGMKKPFDDILSNTMEETTKNLVEKFGAVTGYTQSDEISLVFAPQFKERLIPIEVKDLFFLNDEEEVSYKVYDKEYNLLGSLDIIYEDTEDKYFSINFWIVSDTNDEIIDRCCWQNRNIQTETKSLEVLSKYIIKKVETTNEQIFGGRIQKLTSLIAAYTTMQFNKHFSNFLEKKFEEYDQKLENREIDTNNPDIMKYIKTMEEKVGNAWFDARVYGVSSKEEAFNSIMWRIRDSEKNSRSMYAQTYCSHKSLLGKNGLEQVKYCKETTGKDWEEVEDKFKYGILVKKEKYLKPISEGTMDYAQNEFVERSRIITWTEKLTQFSDDKVEIITRKYK